jgi:hypothetical protein
MTLLLVRVLADVSVNPNSDGMPGAALIAKLLNWLGQVALWGSLASILIGAAAWGLSHQAGYANGSSRGRTLALAGVVGAILTGVAPSVVNLLYKAASS